MNGLNLILLAGSTIALAACAQVEGEPRTSAAIDTSRQCFFSNTINGYGEAPDGPNGEKRLTVSTGPKNDWLFEVIGPCIDLDFAHHIAFDLRTRTSICTGYRETLLVPSNIGARGVERCDVRMLGKLLEEDKAAEEDAG